MEDWRACSDLRKEWLDSSANCWSLSLGSSVGGLPNISWGQISSRWAAVAQIKAKEGGLAILCWTLLRDLLEFILTPCLFFLPDHKSVVNIHKMFSFSA